MSATILTPKPPAAPNVARLEVSQALLDRLQHVVACAFGLLSTGYLAWRLWVRAVNMDAAGETTAQLKFKLAYLTYAMSILMALTAVALLVLAFRHPRRSIPGEGVGP